MSQWNRTTPPTEADADEWGNILVLRENGQKAVYHWEDYNDNYAIDGETAWMTLPQSDVPQPTTITISSGGRTFTIEMVGNRIELHDSRNNKIPIVCADEEGIPGVLYLVESILDDHIRDTPDDDDDDDCGCEGEGVLVNDIELQGFIDGLIVGRHRPEPKPWQKNRGK